MLHTKFMALYFIEPEFNRRFPLREKGSSTFVVPVTLTPDADPMTFTYKLDPSYLQIHGVCEYVKASESYLSERQTDRQDPKVYTTRGWSINNKIFTEGLVDQSKRNAKPSPATVLSVRKRLSFRRH